jgi:integrating conjugative element protein (TIGR03758 family)
MNAAQSAAFEEGAGGYITAPDLLMTIQAIGATVVFLYIAWMCYRAYSDFGAEIIKAGDMITIWFRGLFVMMVLLYLLVN